MVPRPHLWRSSSTRTAPGRAPACTSNCSPTYSRRPVWIRRISATSSSFLPKSLRRGLRGAAIGHFASTEITSPPGSRRMVQALQRMDAPPACIAFYREHVEADAVHEQGVRLDVVGDLVSREPKLDRDVVFGIRAHAVVEDPLADAIMTSWKQDKTSLRQPLS